MNTNQQGKREKFIPLESDQFVTRFSEKRSRKKRLFQKLVLAQSDIHSAYEICKLFGERVASGARPEDTVRVGLNNPLYLPLLQAIVISYARPFIENDGLGVLPKQWSTFENKEFKEAHEFILKYRNELVAHSDTSVRKIQIFSSDANFGPVPKGKKMQGPGYALNTYWISLRQVETFYRLCGFQADRLSKEAMSMLDEVYGRMELPNKAFDLRIDEGL